MTDLERAEPVKITSVTMTGPAYERQRREAYNEGWNAAIEAAARQCEVMAQYPDKQTRTTAEALAATIRNLRKQP